MRTSLAAAMWKAEGAVTGRAREILASVSNTREKVPEGNGYVGKRECLPLLSTG